MISNRLNNELNTCVISSSYDKLKSMLLMPSNTRSSLVECLHQLSLFLSQITHLLNAIEPFK